MACTDARRLCAVVPNHPSGPWVGERPHPTREGGAALLKGDGTHVMFHVKRARFSLQAAGARDGQWSDAAVKARQPGGRPWSRRFFVLDSSASPPRCVPSSVDARSSLVRDVSRETSPRRAWQITRTDGDWPAENRACIPSISPVAHRSLRVHPTRRFELEGRAGALRLSGVLRPLAGGGSIGASVREPYRPFISGPVHAPGRVLMRNGACGVLCACCGARKEPVCRGCHARGEGTELGPADRWLANHGSEDGSGARRQRPVPLFVTLSLTQRGRAAQPFHVKHPLVLQSGTARV